MLEEGILILDFGSQYTQLIARRIRELKVYCEIWPYHKPLQAIVAAKPKGLVLSGGPESVYANDAPTVDRALFELGIPVLGICYGLQLLVHRLGGSVVPTTTREYGQAQVEVKAPDALFAGMSEAGQKFTAGQKSTAGQFTAGQFTAGQFTAWQFTAWMSHGDQVASLPPGFVVTAATDTAPYAAIADPKRRLYGVQFHPEVTHTTRGSELLRNFVTTICRAEPNWTMEHFITRATANLHRQVGEHGRVLCALSGGVDSSVVAALLHRALGDRLTCVFVDNGLLRQGERHNVETIFRDHFKIDLIVVDAKKRFLDRLAGVSDPEEKRKRIGREFIAVFEEVAKPLQNKGKIEFLAQGTLYPDVIESTSVRGPSHTIKTHHNVGGLPEVMKLTLIEPLRELFKDEVRNLGKELGLPERMIWRQPFPGPGLAVRILGEVTEEATFVVQAADVIVEEELRAVGLYQNLWQSFAVLLPVRSVGVMGDQRTYARTIAIRAVTSSDGMTADIADLPTSVLGRMANRIINEVSQVNRVVYDISQKPPATIEWE